MIKIKSTRHNFKIDSLRGVDLTSHPANVQKNRATYMKNMVNESLGQDYFHGSISSYVTGNTNFVNISVFY